MGAPPGASPRVKPVGGKPTPMRMLHHGQDQTILPHTVPMQWAPLLPGESTIGPGKKPIEKPYVAAPRLRTEMPAELAVSSSTTLGRQRSASGGCSDGKLFSRDAIIAPRLDSKRKGTQIIVSGRFALPGIGVVL